MQVLTHAHAHVRKPKACVHVLVHVGVHAHACECVHVQEPIILLCGSQLGIIDQIGIYQSHESHFASSLMVRWC